ncbi:MAG: hypothetical protein JXA77_15580 [Bacteroidales bacterium]|nr:hypothetical protein [Bacteroidales bacterium]
MKEHDLIKLLFIFPTFVIFILLLSCVNKQTEFAIKESIEIKTIKGITIDTVIISPKSFSGEGFFVLEDSNILYFDEIFATVSIFDLKGNYISTQLGLGQGPNEINGLQQYLKFKDKRLIFKGFSIYTFDLNWNKIAFSQIDWGQHHSLRELSKNPDPEYHDLYEVKYFENSFKAFDDQHIIFSIETSHPNFNFCTTKEYYKTSRIFAKLNIETNRIDEIFGTKSEKYLSYNLLPIYDYHYYDIANDTIFINFEPDYLIYMYDKKYRPINAFGVPGKIINDDYLQTLTIKEYDNSFHSDRAKRGFYNHLKYIPTTNYLFRNYYTGKKESENEDTPNPLRLQIYQKENIVGDVEVPAKFRVIGYTAPWYYADGYIDESGEDIIVGFYRFKINF